MGRSSLQVLCAVSPLLAAIALSKIRRLTRHVWVWAVEDWNRASHRHRPLLLAVLATAGAASAPARAEPFAYVTNYGYPGKAYVLDIATNTPVATMDSCGYGGPSGMAVTPDQRFIYVACSPFFNVNPMLNRIDTSLHAVDREIVVGGQGHRARDVAVTPDGGAVYAALDAGVWVVDTATNTVVAALDGWTHDGLLGGLRIAITPDGAFAYVVTGGNVAVLSTQAKVVVSSIPIRVSVVEGRTLGLTDIVFSHDGKHAYVSVDTGVAVIDAAKAVDDPGNAITTIIPLPGAHRLALAPDGRSLWVARYYQATAISIIDTATNSEIGSIASALAGELPGEIAIARDGAAAYVVTRDGSDARTAVIDTATRAVLTWIRTSGNSGGMGVAIAGGEPPAPFAVVPDRGGDTGSVSVLIRHLSGPGFVNGATVSLERAGEPGIVGAPVGVGGDGQTVTTAFDLRGQPRGTWDVVVTNPDGTSVTLRDGFAIEEGRGPHLWTDIVCPTTLRAGREHRCAVVYGNHGDTDAFGVPLNLRGFPKDATVKLGFEVTPPPLPAGIDPINWNEVPVEARLDDQKLLPLFLGHVPAGSSNILPFTLSVPTTGEVDLRVEMEEPVLGSFSCARPVEPKDGPAKQCVKSLIGNALDLALEAVPGASCLKTALEQSVDGAVAFGKLVCEVLENNVTRDTVVGSRNQMLVLMFKVAKDCATDVIPMADLVEKIEKGYALLETGYKCLKAAWKAIKVFVARALDPNDKVGAQGSGAARYLSGEEPLRYAIHFENQETATAPAQEVLVTDPLDSAMMELSTLSLGPIAFGSRQVVPPEASAALTTDVDLRPERHLIVRIDASLDRDTGLLTWRFSSVDPDTGRPPEDPLAGFLPPNRNPPEGDGSIFFTVMPKRGLPTGTVIRNQARIVFDQNQPIDTPEWFNTLDNTRPRSQIDALGSPTCAQSL